jgi:hypothetical protein
MNLNPATIFDYDGLPITKIDPCPSLARFTQVHHKTSITYVTTSSTFHLPPSTFHLPPCTLHLASCTLHLAPCTLHLAAESSRGSAEAERSTQWTTTGPSSAYAGRLSWSCIIDRESKSNWGTDNGCNVYPETLPCAYGEMQIPTTEIQTLAARGTLKRSVAEVRLFTAFEWVFSQFLRSYFLSGKALTGAAERLSRRLGFISTPKFEFDLLTNPVVPPR